MVATTATDLRASNTDQFVYINPSEFACTKMGRTDCMVASFRQSYQRNIQSARGARHDVTNFANFCGFSYEEISDIVLAVGEAVSNVLEHAKSPQGFNVRCEFGSQTLVVNVEDYGSGFMPTYAPRPQSRGFGISLMKQVMDRVKFSFKRGNGTVLRLEKRKPTHQIHAPRTV